MQYTSLANIEKWACRIPMPAYAIHDQTAIKVTDDTIEVMLPERMVIVRDNLLGLSRFIEYPL